ncbi:hypothetical protein APR08_005481 [Nocardia amikacinitolerans]|nr:hypothetical protein [Nocardia amikacinitolerans]
MAAQRVYAEPVDCDGTAVIAAEAASGGGRGGTGGDQSGSKDLASAT